MTGATRVTRTSTDAPADGAPLSGAALRREQGRREMRAAILDEARRLLTEEGASALSMRAIARALGYSPAALYEYFPAKEDIYKALYFEGTGGLGSRMVAARDRVPADSSVRTALFEMGRAYRAYAHGQPELFRLVFGDTSVHGQSPKTDDERPGFDELVAVIADGIASGEIDAPAAEPVAVACWAIVHGFVVLEIIGCFGPNETRVVSDPASPTTPTDGRPSPDALFDQTLDRILLGVLTRKH